MYANKLGRFQSPDDFQNDTSPSDPQRYNLYAYVRNNPLTLIDPTGEKGEVDVKTDERKKTGVITITASIGVYVHPGSKISVAQRDIEVATLKKQLENNYNGQFKHDGITYTVKLSLTVKTYSSEDEAEKAGASGKVDNIAALIRDDLIDETSSYGKKTREAEGLAYTRSGENFDRMAVAIFGATEKGQTYAHEFGHLLGIKHLKDIVSDKGLMAKFVSNSTRFNQKDFDRGFVPRLYGWDKNGGSSTRDRWGQTSKVSRYGRVSDVKHKVRAVETFGIGYKIR